MTIEPATAAINFPYCKDCGSLAINADTERAYAENRANDELQIDRAEPESRIMHGAVWVKSWTRVRAVEDIPA